MATFAPFALNENCKVGGQNYLFSGFVGLAASTIYFSISPIRDAHAEIIARTQPTVYDVLIALFVNADAFNAASASCGHAAR